MATHGIPTALIDWVFAGPVDPSWDLVQAAWLNAQLHDEDSRAGGVCQTPTAGQISSLLLDGHGIPRHARDTLVDDLVAFAVRDAAAKARNHHVQLESTAAVAADGHPVLWAVTWRTLIADWILRHRAILERAIS